jgi:hypothetical protein
VTRRNTKGRARKMRAGDAELTHAESAEQTRRLIERIGKEAIKERRSAEKFPALEGRGVQSAHPRIVNISFDVSQEVAAALRALRDTGLFGNGLDCTSVAEELLRKALLNPEILPYWQKRRNP